jgi:hypothetical protein
MKSTRTSRARPRPQVQSQAPGARPRLKVQAQAPTALRGHLYSRPSRTQHRTTRAPRASLPGHSPHLSFFSLTDISGITDILPGFSPYWLSPITSFHHIGDNRYYRDILESVPTLRREVHSQPYPLCDRLCPVLVCRGRYGLGGGVLLFILGSNWGGVGPERGLRGGGEKGWCEEWARSG